jgi:hypothetical protein
MNTNSGDEGRLLDETQRIVDRAYQRIKVERQYRRLSTALRKLGVTGLVGNSWCFIDEDSLEISFGALPDGRLGLFIEHLVDLAEEVDLNVRERVLVGSPEAMGPEQLQLDLGPDFTGGTNPQSNDRA